MTKNNFYLPKHDTIHDIPQIAPSSEDMSSEEKFMCKENFQEF